MKYSMIKLSMSMFILCLYFFSFQVTCGKASTGLTTETTGVFNEIEAKKFAVFAKFANCGKKPLTKTCKTCLKPQDGFKMFFFYQVTRMKKYHYKFFIHYNDKTKQVVISFGAPSVDNHKYIQLIYTRGWSMIRSYKIKVEKEFKIIYFLKLKKILTEKVKKLKKSGRLAYKFYFTGYSLGASLATLSALDLTKSKVISKVANNPTVYTYGGLRIGDSSFVSLVNRVITLWRVVKQNDYMVRIPNCYYSVVAKVWRCFTTPVLNRYIIRRNFPLRTYYTRYIRRLTRGPLGKLQILRKNNAQIFKRHPAVMKKGPVGRFPNMRFRQVHRRQLYVNRPTVWKTPQYAAPRKQLVTIRRNLINTYHKYIYYTQPIGREIFYNSAMTNYKTCAYVNGIPACEKINKLPSSFTATSHKVYYGINFDQC